MRADLDATFAALSDPTRRGVIDLLRVESLRASEIAEALSMSRPAMSRHLRVLRDSGLVVEEEIEADARVRMYSLKRKPFAEMRGWLDEVEAFWGDQLDAFKSHVERRAKPAATSRPKR